MSAPMQAIKQVDRTMCADDDSDGHLLHVVEVLHAWGLAQVDPMSNVLTQHESTDQVVCVTSLPCKHTQLCQHQA